jgi:hypothetical protein
MKLDPIEVEVKLVAAEPPGPDAPLTPLLDAVVAHRAAALAKGFSQEVADQMSIQLHSWLLALYYSGNESEGALPPAGDADPDAIG